jgi:hypothetical protein
MRARTHTRTRALICCLISDCIWRAFSANAFGIFALVAGVVDVLLYGILLFGVHKVSTVEKLVRF